MENRKLQVGFTGEGKRHLMFFCSGCDDVHQVNDGWTWNDSLDKPTFSPSVKVTYYDGQEIRALCHSYVKEGRIQYLEDSTHILKGQTIDMIDWKKDR